MTEGMMGRTSDTRMYAPRSESSHMFRANHEDERTPTGNEDAKDKEARMDRRQKKKEAEEKEDKKIRHIKVRRHHMGLNKPDEAEEEEGFKPRESPSEPTPPPGSGGFLTSLAAQAKGPGAAAGQMIQMSEPMDMAWRLLKYDDDDDDLYDEDFYYDYDGTPRDPRKNPEHEYHEENMYDEAGEELKDEIEQLRESPGFFNKPEPAVTEEERKEEALRQHIADFLSSQRFKEQKNASEPMEHAWSEILKSKRKKEKRRKTEQRAKWRPSTGKFKRPRGGYTGRSGTGARAKLLSRNLPMGRKRGLMRAHPSVEFSHRGIASKQPMSQADPQGYGQFRGYQEQQNIMGQIRPTSGARLPMGQVNMPRAPRPRLHPVRAPPIQPPRLRTPHLNRPKMPGMVTMSEDPIPEGGLLKARGQNPYLLAEARQAIIALKKLMREVKDKDSKKKGKGTPDTSGAASNLPNHPANSPKQTTNPEGPTESDTDARQFGVDPIGHVIGRGGNRA